MDKSTSNTDNFPTLSFKLSSVSHWGEWYDTLQTGLRQPFKAKRDIVKVKQSRLHAVRGSIATTVDPNVHKIAIRDIRKKLDRRPADDDADKTDDVSVREIVVYLRDRFAPNATNIRAGILKKYNQHLEEAKRANTSFDTWLAQWNVLYHKAMSQDVGEVKGIEGIEGIESFVDAISVRFDPDWARGTTRVTAAKDYVPEDDSLLKLADDYCRYRQAVRRTATGGREVHATLGSQSDQGTASKGTSSEKKNPNCPCGDKTHYWKPEACRDLYQAITGDISSKKLNKTRVKTMKYAYNSSKFSSLRASIHHNGWQVKPKEKTNAVDSPDDVAAATIDPELLNFELL
ncbi:hypothetical protein E4U15_003618 [Claviceps sp. LM218 group G6]|nr:hypothetical protein E4U15_003618 [Claviceps sp. LM218 group G6]